MGGPLQGSLSTLRRAFQSALLEGPGGPRGSRRDSAGSLSRRRSVTGQPAPRKLARDSGALGVSSETATLRSRHKSARLVTPRRQRPARRISTASQETLAVRRVRRRRGSCDSSAPPSKIQRTASREALQESLREARAAALAAGSTPAADAVAQAGDAEETEAEHGKRHAVFSKSCPRCVYVTLRRSWEATFGTWRCERNGERVGIVWLAERPARMGGAWALGCKFCADLRRRAEEDAQGAPSNHRLRTKWGSFDVRSMSQMKATAMRQHAHSAVHKIATAVFLAPDTPVVRCLQATRGDDERRGPAAS